MENRALTIEQAGLVFDLLIKECEANPDLRDEFVRYHVTDPWYFPTEFRFMGNLGFGGKFWNEHNRWAVSCYPEDKTEERAATVARTNQLLEELWKRFH